VLITLARPQDVLLLIYTWICLFLRLQAFTRERPSRWAGAGMHLACTCCSRFAPGSNPHTDCRCIAPGPGAQPTPAMASWTTR